MDEVLGLRDEVGAGSLAGAQLRPQLLVLCGEVAYARWAQCEDVSGGAIAGTIAVHGSSAMKVLKGEELVAYALIG